MEVDGQCEVLKNNMAFSLLSPSLSPSFGLSSHAVRKLHERPMEVLQPAVPAEALVSHQRSEGRSGVFRQPVF